MKTSRIRSFALAALATAMLGCGALPATAACLSSSQAEQAVASGQAVRLGAIMRQVGGEIVNAQLCESGGRLVYQLAVSSGGQVRTVVVDAASGQILSQ